jgi:hypothetical protein
MSVLLSRLRIVNLGPFHDLAIDFESAGEPRRSTVITGAGGIGKSSLLYAIGSTRPGHVLLHPQRWRVPTLPTFVVADWILGDDDPARSMPLRIVTANAPPASVGETEDAALQRRRDATAFERRLAESGFAFLSISGARWFSRTPVTYSSPDKSILRYDPRTTPTFDDGSRGDLARETKQVLTLASVANALVERSGAADEHSDPLRRTPASLDAPLREAIDALMAESGFLFRDADPSTLEPVFETSQGARVLFDDLPSHVRHLVAIGTLTLRTLFTAYPRRDGDPREFEGVVLVDDVELHQPENILRRLAPMFAEIFPRVQWILATSSPEVAWGAGMGAVTLRRAVDSDSIEAHEGEFAITH